MSIGFFYNTEDWANKEIVKQLRKKGIKVEVIKIKDFGLGLQDKFRHKIYVNRVTSIRDKENYDKKTYMEDLNTARFALELSKHLENIGKKVINPFLAAYMDYSKTEASNELKKAGIPTPECHLFATKKAALKKRFRFPRVVKIDLGGWATDVKIVKDRKEYEKTVKKIAKAGHLIHVEEYIRPEDHVTRVFVLGNKFQCAYKSLGRDRIVSSCRGAKMVAYPDVPKRLKKMCEKATRRLKCEIAGMDIIETKEKDYVVDMNPTPAYSHHKAYIELTGVNPAERIADYIAEQHRKQK